MSLGSLVGLLACLGGALLLEWLVARGVRAVMLAAAPLSGEQIDSFTYERTPWTVGEPQLVWLWLALALAGAGVWGAWHFERPVLVALGLLAWAAGLGWDLWSWERVAASVKFVTWRRGWRQSARRVPISRLAEVSVHEKPGPGPAGVCYLALVLDDGKVVKLPRCSSWGGLSRVEDVANFVRLQMQQVAELQQRAANERRRRTRPPADPLERELRQRLKALRQSRPGQAATPPR
ncbi:hypothetical protein OOT46_02190 [Aquabacterium sp. A7-Y]|uniref:hypothetical protein n=1 Tax=Aquabacterium sp. A7-Y TaxID=1349605 RepID=UPI00223E0105|nr:hypothetical protein [Aquabacterium sp. A7-Y]MCW7536667.1 hypothetical protein [Aquabacterium sp. A7-Y]